MKLRSCSHHQERKGRQLHSSPPEQSAAQAHDHDKSSQAQPDTDITYIEHAVHPNPDYYTYMTLTKMVAVAFLISCQTKLN